jgi:phosphatidylglycerophosphatase C
LTFTDAGPDHKRFGAAVEKKNDRMIGSTAPQRRRFTINMGGRQPGRQGQDGEAVVAFDFDGTLSYRDAFLAFLAWRSGPLRWRLGLLRLAPAAFLYLFNRDRGRLKAAAVNEFLKGLDRSALVRSCADFAKSPAGAALIRPDAEQCWTQWRQKGATLAIVTASPEEVIAPFAERLGADVLIGTRLGFDAEGRVTGAFEGLNCRGEEKVVRLEARFGGGLRLKAAYGDTSGDLPMLAIAEIKGYRVFHALPR